MIVEVAVSDGDSDSVIGHLWMSGTTGIEERIQPEDPERLLLRAGFPSATAADNALATMPVQYEELARVTPDGSELDLANQFARPVAIGTELLVVPQRASADQDIPPDNGAVVVTIDAGRSFGHGGHPTTRLALAAIVEVVTNNHGSLPEAVADIGCGSGALVISALKLGINRGVAIDIEPDAITATEANAATNQVEGNLELHQGDLQELPQGSLGRFPLVVANLEAPTQEQLAPRLLGLVEPGGVLILSGVLASRWPTLSEHFAGATERGSQELDGWICPVLQLRVSGSTSDNAAPSTQPK